MTVCSMYLFSLDMLVLLNRFNLQINILSLIHLEYTGVGSLSLLQGTFPTQGSNPGLLHCRWILYQLSHKGSGRILQLFGSLFLLQGIFLTQESNRGFLHCRWILYQLSYQGSLN